MSPDAVMAALRDQVADIILGAPYVRDHVLFDSRARVDHARRRRHRDRGRVAFRQNAPHVVLGVQASADLALSPPETQPGLLSGFAAQACLQFNVTEKLSFRLGVPLTGKLVTQEADEAMGLPSR